MLYNSPEYLKTLADLRAGTASDAAAAATGQAFLTAELARYDPVLRLPLENFTWYRDIPQMLGGGWLDYEIARNVDFRGPSDNGTGTQSNDIRVLEYNMSQDTWPTQAYQVNTRIPLVDSLKLAQAGRSPQDLLDKAVRVDWNKSLDNRVYRGINSQTGLVNNTQVTSNLLPTTGTGTTRTFSTKTGQNIVDDFNLMSRTAWTNSGASSAGIPNRYLVDAGVFPFLQNPMSTTGGSGVQMSIAEYIKKFGWASNFGIEVEIYPLPTWLATAGASGASRIVAYRFDEDCLSFSLLQNITRMGGPLSIQAGAFLVTYVGNTGVVKVNRPTTIAYWDGA